METKNTTPLKRVPLYKRRKFWLAVLVAAVLAVGVAIYFLTQKTSVEEPQIQKSGTLSVDTEPGNATISVDGEERKERSDTKLRLKPGKHEVKLELAGYDEAVIPVEIKEGEPSSIEHTFTKQGGTPVKEKVSQFKTYRNAKYGYSIRYPSRWEVVASDPEAVVFKDPKAAGGAGSEGEERAPLTILTLANPKLQGPAEWYRARDEYPHEDQSQIKQRRITVNGQEAYQYETPYGFVPYLITVLTNGKHAYLLQQIQDSPNRKLYDQALGTFEFES